LFLIADGLCHDCSQEETEFRYLSVVALAMMTDSFRAELVL